MICYINRVPYEVLETIFFMLAGEDGNRIGKNFMTQADSSLTRSVKALPNHRMSSTGLETGANISKVMEVCRKWQNLVKQNPRFWWLELYFDRRLDPPEKRQQRQVQAQMWRNPPKAADSLRVTPLELLERSKDCQCNLDVVFDFHGDYQSALSHLKALAAHGHQIRRFILKAPDDDKLEYLVPIVNQIEWRRLEEFYVCLPRTTETNVAPARRINLSSAIHIQSLSFANTDAISTIELPKQMRQLRALLFIQRTRGGANGQTNLPALRNLLTRGSKIERIALHANLFDPEQSIEWHDTIALPGLRSLRVPKDLGTLCVLQQHFGMEALVSLEIDAGLCGAESQGEHSGAMLQQFSNLKRLVLKISIWDRFLDQLLSEISPPKLDRMIVHLVPATTQPDHDHSGASFSNSISRILCINILVIFCEGPHPYLGKVLSRISANSTVQRLVVETSLSIPMPLFFRSGESILSNHSDLLPNLLHLDCRKLMPQDIDALLNSLHKARLNTLTHYSDFSQWASIVAPLPADNKQLDGLASLPGLGNLTTLAIAIDTARLATASNPLLLFPHVENLSLSIPSRREARPKEMVDIDQVAFRSLFLLESEHISVPQLKNLHIVLEKGYPRTWERVAQDIAQWRAMKGLPLDSCVTRCNGEERVETEAPGLVVYDYDWDSAASDITSNLPWKLSFGHRDHFSYY
jgi:hypothetical protein